MLKKMGRPSLISAVPTSKLDKVLLQLLERFNDNQRELADAINRSQPHVHGLLRKSGKQTLSPTDALYIEVATQGDFKCEDLCPELAGVFKTIKINRQYKKLPALGE